MKRLAVSLAILSAASCGGGGGGTGPTGPSPAVQTTESFSGTTTQSAVNACGGDSHNITAQEGDIAVRLVATSDPSGMLSLQVCPSGVDSGGNCTIPQQRIAVGQTLNGARKGTPLQNIKPLPFACVFTGAVNTTPMTYTLSVTYMK
jgi:hypothetical protein